MSHWQSRPEIGFPFSQNLPKTKWVLSWNDRAVFWALDSATIDIEAVLVSFSSGSLFFFLSWSPLVCTRIVSGSQQQRWVSEKNICAIGVDDESLARRFFWWRQRRQWHSKRLSWLRLWWRQRPFFWAPRTTSLRRWELGDRRECGWERRFMVTSKKIA